MPDIKKKWKTGDLVMLKSGGPKMTVSKVNGTRVECQWFTRLQSAAAINATATDQWMGPMECSTDEDALTDATPSPVVVNEVTP